MSRELHLNIAILHLCEEDERDDSRGLDLACRFADAGHRLADLVVVPNQPQAALRQLAIWRDCDDVDVVLTLPSKSSNRAIEMGGVRLTDGRLGDVHVIPMRSALTQLP